MTVTSEITSKELCNKIRTLCYGHTTGVTTEVLEKICEEPAAQPFLKWFCENISERNVVTDEDLLIKDKLQNAGEWLEGTALEYALEKITQDCPEVLKLIRVEQVIIDDIQVELEITRESQIEDEKYEQSLQTGLQNLKALDNKLDEWIEEEQALLEKEQIETDKAFKDCSVTLEQFHKGNHIFLDDVESVLAVYAYAAENREPPIILTQMPLDLFVKQLELYNTYLGMYVKRQFGINDKTDQETDSDYVSLEPKEKQTNLREFMWCKTNLADAHKKEILSKVLESHVVVAMLQRVQDIYNDGDARVPTQSELRAEIEELTAVRDSLEEDVNLLRDRHLTDVVQYFAELETAEALKYVAEARLERRNTTLENIKNLQTLAREQGHLYADLLCILMEIQFRRLKVVGEFIPLARQYLSTEYSLSSARCENMKQLIEEYGNVVSQLSKGANVFNKYFSSLVYGEDVPHHINDVLTKYNEILSNNEEHEDKTLDALFNTRINALIETESDINSYYIEEVHHGPTHSLNPISYEIRVRYDEAFDALQSVESELKKIRNKLKERMRSATGLAREIDILWQRFLADPDTLKANYSMAMKKAEKTHFGKS